MAVAAAAESVTALFSEAVLAMPCTGILSMTSMPFSPEADQVAASRWLDPIPSPIKRIIAGGLGTSVGVGGGLVSIGVLSRDSIVGVDTSGSVSVGLAVSVLVGSRPISVGTALSVVDGGNGGGAGVSAAQPVNMKIRLNENRTRTLVMLFVKIWDAIVLFYQKYLL